MLELLNSNIDLVEMYLKPLNKYFIQTCIKLEKHGKHYLSRNKSSSELMYNLDYIKNQNNDILRTLGTT